VINRNDYSESGIMLTITIYTQILSTAKFVMVCAAREFMNLRINSYVCLFIYLLSL